MVTSVPHHILRTDSDQRNVTPSVDTSADGACSKTWEETDLED